MGNRNRVYIGWSHENIRDPCDERWQDIFCFKNSDGIAYWFNKFYHFDDKHGKYKTYFKNNGEIVSEISAQTLYALVCDMQAAINDASIMSIFFKCDDLNSLRLEFFDAAPVFRKHIKRIDNLKRLKRKVPKTLYIEVV